MVKIGFMLVLYACGWLLAVGIGMFYYRTDAGGMPVKRRYADLWALISMVIGLGLVAFLTVRVGYGVFVQLAMLVTGNHGQTFFLNEWAAVAEACALCAFWTLIACWCYWIGISCSADYFLRPMGAEINRQRRRAAMDGLADEEARAGLLEVMRDDSRLAKAFEACFVDDGRSYCRTHKNPAVSESHIGMTTEIRNGDDTPVVAAFSVETDELVHPHLRAGEIVQMMMFAGWQKILHRVEDESGYWERCFAVPSTDFRLGYAAELRSAALAKKQLDCPLGYVDVTDIVNVLKDEGVKLRRDPKVHEEWRATRAAET